MPRQWTNKRGQGRGIKLIREHVDYDGSDCLVWPMNRLPSGYGVLGFEGKLFYAHRYMCELVNGPPPTPTHEAAHSCGNGHLGCYHPKHVRWKTPKENAEEAGAHGALVQAHRAKAIILTPEQVAEIRPLRGFETGTSVALRYGVSRDTILDIWRGRTWRIGSKPRVNRVHC